MERSREGGGGGGQDQEPRPWGCEWLLFLVKLRALKGFHLDRGAWHGSGEALGKTLVSLLERGGGGRRLSGGMRSGGLGRPSSNTWVPPCRPSCSWGGGVEDPGGREDVHGAPPQMEVRQLRRNHVASVGWIKRKNPGVQSPQGGHPRSTALLGQDRGHVRPERRCTTSWGTGCNSPGCRLEKGPNRLPPPPPGGGGAQIIAV